MKLSEKQKQFYEKQSKWKLTHENMHLTDLCALVEYHTQLRCLIEADLDTPFDYDELRYLLEDYGYTLSEDDNKILDEALEITNKLIEDLQTDINIFRQLTDVEKFKYELQCYNITMADIVELYYKIDDNEEAKADLIGTYAVSDEYYCGERDEGYTLWAKGIDLWSEEINLTETDRKIIDVAIKYNDVTINIPFDEIF